MSAHRERRVGSATSRWKGGPVALVCVQCGIAYVRKRGNHIGSRFCNRACRSAWDRTRKGIANPRWRGGREQTVCLRCGLQFQRRRSAIGTPVFCSRTCANQRHVTTGHKICARCKQPGQFSKDKSRRDGLYHTCKRCLNRPRPVRIGPKLCARCKQSGSFGKDKSRRDGLNHTCSDCIKKRPSLNQASSERAKVTKAKWKAANIDRVKRVAAARRRKDAERLRAWNMNYYMTHRAERSAYNAMRDARPEIRARKRQLAAAWKLANKEAKAASAHRRRARALAIENTLTTSDVKDAIQASCGLCAYCLEPYQVPNVDHVISLFEDGSSNTAENIVIACRRCNSRKGDRGVLFMLSPAWSIGRRARQARRSKIEPTEPILA